MLGLREKESPAHTTPFHAASAAGVDANNAGSRVFSPSPTSPSPGVVITPTPTLFNPEKEICEGSTKSLGTPPPGKSFSHMECSGKVIPKAPPLVYLGVQPGNFLIGHSR